MKFSLALLIPFQISSYRWGFLSTSCLAGPSDHPPFTHGFMLLCTLLITWHSIPLFLSPCQLPPLEQMILSVAPSIFKPAMLEESFNALWNPPCLAHNRHPENTVECKNVFQERKSIQKMENSFTLQTSTNLTLRKSPVFL